MFIDTRAMLLRIHINYQGQGPLQRWCFARYELWVLDSSIEPNADYGQDCVDALDQQAGGSVFNGQRRHSVSFTTAVPATSMHQDISIQRQRV